MSSRFCYVLPIILALSKHTALAQHFGNSYASVAYPNLTEACTNALNSTISCDDSLLTAMSPNGLYPDSHQLDSLCTDQCSTSLRRLHSDMSRQCSPADVVAESGMTYAASLLAENYLYYYAAVCRRDRFVRLYSSRDCCHHVLTQHQDDWEVLQLHLLAVYECYGQH